MGGRSAGVGRARVAGGGGMRFRVPRGMRDILPEEVSRWRGVEETFRRVCALHGYEEIRTPLVEHTELFARGVGQHTDIVSKEMYTIPSRDEDGESLTL